MSIRIGGLQRSRGAGLGRRRGEDFHGHQRRERLQRGGAGPGLLGAEVLGYEALGAAHAFHSFFQCGELLYVVDCSQLLVLFARRLHDHRWVGGECFDG